MITANELRVGNIIQTQTGYTVKVKTIGDIGINFSCGLHGPEHEFWFERLKPIAIIPEILEKVGFKKCTCGGWKRSDPHFHIDADDSYRGLFHIATVHQLQNIYFALTGKELEITL